MKRAGWVSGILLAGLVGVFYLGVWLIPLIAHAVAARSLYNYRAIVEQAVARGDYDGAVATLEEASCRIPRDIYFERPEFMYERIGRIRQQQGNTSASLAAFLEAQRRYFRNIDLQGYLPPPRLICDIIEAYFQTGNLAGAYNEACVALDFYPVVADTFLQSHMRRDEPDPRARRDLAILEHKLGRVGSARGRLESAVRDDPALIGGHVWLARIAEQTRTTATMVAEYEKELANDPYATDAAKRLLQLYGQLARDTANLRERMRRTRSSVIAEFVSTEGAKPLASLWGVGARVNRTFEVPEPGRLLINIQANSTPCDGLYGWVEVVLDERHIQTLYLDDRPGYRGVKTYGVRLDRVDAGSHTLVIENLSDALNATSDRNVFIHGIQVYHLDGDAS